MKSNRPVSNVSCTVSYLCDPGQAGQCYPNLVFNHIENWEEEYTLYETQMSSYAKAVLNI